MCLQKCARIKWLFVRCTGERPHQHQDFIADALSRWHQSQLPAAAAVAAPATITATNTSTSSSSTGIRPGSAGAVASAATSTNTTPARKIVENFSSAGLQALRQLYAPEVRWRLNYSLAPNIAGPHDGIEATVCGLPPWWCRGGCRRFLPSIASAFNSLRS